MEIPQYHNWYTVEGAKKPVKLWCRVLDIEEKRRKNVSDPINEPH